MKTIVDTKNIGRLATIENTGISSHTEMKGRVGFIQKAVKSRNVYELRILPENTIWTAHPENVRIL